MPKRSDVIYQAQAILSRRDHSQAEVRQKLARKGFSNEQVKQAVSWLHEQRLLDDRKFAVAYVESVLRGRPVGRRYLKAKLYERGIDSGISQEVIGRALAGDREEELAHQAAASWSRTHRPDPARLQRFLLARGFTSDVIERIL